MPQEDVSGKKFSGLKMGGRGYSFHRSELGGWGRDRWEDVLQGQISKALPHRPGDYMTKSQGLRCFLGLDSSPDKNSMDQ